MLEIPPFWQGQSSTSTNEFLYRRTATRFYGIDIVAHELGVNPFSLRCWEENGLITSERATMGKTTFKIYDEETMRLVRRAKDLMNTGVTVAQAFAQAHDEIERDKLRND